LTALLDLALAAARHAGTEILRVYAGEFEVAQKADLSPVTEADHAAHRIIHAALAPTGIPIVSEEAALPADAPERFWVVDPLDGTKEFVARRGEFSVNIALVEGRRPILGVVYAPVSGVAYAAVGGRATRDGAPIQTRVAPQALVVVHSRSHTVSPKLDAWLAAQRVAVAERIVAGSAIKFGLVAEGVADLYPRLGPTCEWDTAAGQAVLEAAGGSVTDLDGAPLLYGKPGFLNTGFVARGRAA
jgi:3'(2'), 5'-bisphosphate nucleotidase